MEAVKRSTAGSGAASKRPPRSGRRDAGPGGPSWDMGANLQKKKVFRKTAGARRIDARGGAA
jgi:hypothetical protein